MTATLATLPVGTTFTRPTKVGTIGTYRLHAHGTHGRTVMAVRLDKTEARPALMRGDVVVEVVAA
jgi:hypothetical protein